MKETYRENVHTFHFLHVKQKEVWPKYVMQN